MTTNTKLSTKTAAVGNPLTYAGAVTVLGNHRGPWRLMVVRPHKHKTCCTVREWLAGEVAQGAEAVEEAWAILTDPRDTILSVHFWSVGEESFCGWLK